MLGECDEQYAWMASKVVLANGDRPGRNSVRTFFQRVDQAGGAWYPGYSPGARRRKAALNPQKRRAIASSMMAAKKRGIEPGYEVALSLAPSVIFNVATQAPFSRTTINDVLTTECYDSDPSRPWEFRLGTRRQVLTDGDSAVTGHSG